MRLKPMARFLPPTDGVCGCWGYAMLEPTPYRTREMHHFALLDRKEQHAAIEHLASSGMSDYTVASATMLSVELVRAILGERAASP